MTGAHAPVMMMMINDDNEKIIIMMMMTTTTMMMMTMMMMMIIIFTTGGSHLTIKWLIKKKMKLVLHFSAQLNTRLAQICNGSLNQLKSNC